MQTNTYPKLTLILGKVTRLEAAKLPQRGLIINVGRRPIKKGLNSEVSPEGAESCRVYCLSNTLGRRVYPVGHQFPSGMYVFRYENAN